MAPILFFDTNVAVALKSAHYKAVNQFWGWLHANYRYAIAPTVIAEILKSLRDDPEKYLETARRDLSALHGPGEIVMLPLQGIFLGKTLFGIDREHPHVTAEVMARVLEAGRRMKRVVRRKGLTLLVEHVEYDAIVLDYMVDPILEGEASMFAAMEATKEQKAAPLEPEEWARHILEACGLPVSAEACRTLAEACKAAYALQRFLWLQAVDGYNPKKHRGDWMDKQLLLYLAYPQAVFVTCEKQLPKRIDKSGQENQVRAFDELWAESQA